MADHVGIYAISGAFLPNPATPVRLSQVTPTGILVTRSFTEGHVPGGATLHVPSQETLLDYGNETVIYNACRSGSEIIETLDDGSTLEIPIYLSKVDRFIHTTHNHIGTMADVFKNIPQSAPSQSILIASAIPTGSYYNFPIGTTATTIVLGDGLVATIVINLNNPAVLSYVLAALSGNILTVTNGAYTASFGVDVATGAGSSVTVLPFSSQPRSGTTDWAPGCTVNLLSWYPLSSSVSGVFLNRTSYEPSTIEVPVDVSGNIRDIRVWCELVHDTRGGALPSNVYARGLQGLQLSLRSPSTNFRSAHPLWNAPGVDQLPLRTESELTGSGNRFGAFYYNQPELLRNSYLLWSGHAVDGGTQARWSGSSDDWYHEFDYDLDIRTTFWDGSSINNPRDISSLHPSDGTVYPYWYLTSSIENRRYQQFYQSPTLGAIKFGAQGSDFSSNPLPSGSLTCSGVPWMFDSRLHLGNLQPVNRYGDFFARAQYSIPPQGWLTAKEARVGGWQSASISSTFDYLFSGGTIFVRPGVAYLAGGEDIDGAGLMSSHVAAVPFTVNTDIQTITLGTSNILVNSSVPVSRSRMGAEIFTSLAGEHVILVGGKTSSVDTVGSTGSFIGDFVGSVDIDWQEVSSLPYPLYGAFVHFVDHTIHVFGGFTSGSANTGTLKLRIDPDSGRPESEWQIGSGYISGAIAGAAPIVGPDGITRFILASVDGGVSQIALINGEMQGQTAIFDSDFNVNTYPVEIAGGHIFMVHDGVPPATATLAYTASFNSTSSLYETSTPDNLGNDPHLNHTIASSGSSALYGNAMFVGCGLKGTVGGYPTTAKCPQLYVSNVVIDAPGENEFLTQGKQFGPTTIRPVYPVLDDVYSVKVFDDPLGPLASNRGEIRGFRQGLRNTQPSGTWELMLGSIGTPFNSETGIKAEPLAGVWFRQARIELVVDSGRGLNDCYPSRSRQWLKSSLVPSAKEFQEIALISGSCQWDVGLNETDLFQFSDYGRSVGITSESASAPASIAVQTFITGNLYTALSDQGIVNPEWFLGGNGFGTPYIPDSSMSLGLTGTAEEIDASASQEIYNRTVGQQTIIPNANTMVDYLRRINYSETTQQIWEDVQSSLSTGSGGYFPGL